MVDEGADLLDVGGASSRPGHARLDPDEEIARVVPGHPRGRRRAPGDAAVDRHDEPGRRGGGPRRRRPPAQRHLGRRRRSRHGPPRGGRAACPIVADAQPRRGALPERRRGGRRGPPAGDRPGARRRRPVGPPRRRPGVRVRQDARPQPRAARATSARSASSAARCCWARRASRPWASCSTCPPTSGSRRPPPRPRWGSRPASTSSASTTCSRTSAPPGSRMRSSAAGGPDGLGRRKPDARAAPMTDRIRHRGHGVPGHARRPRAGAAAPRSRSRSTWSSALDLEPAGLHATTSSGRSTTARCSTTCRQIVESTRSA